MCKLRQKLKLHLLTARKYIWYVIKNAVKSEMYTHNIIRILDGLFCNNCVEYLKPQTAMMPRTFFFFAIAHIVYVQLVLACSYERGHRSLRSFRNFDLKRYPASAILNLGVAKYPIRRGVATS